MEWKNLDEKFKRFKNKLEKLHSMLLMLPDAFKFANNEGEKKMNHEKSTNVQEITMDEKIGCVGKGIGSLS